MKRNLFCSKGKLLDMTKSHNPRFYTPDLAVGKIELPASEARHAATVKRLSIGDNITLFDGSGKSAQAIIVSATKRQVIVQVNKIAQQQASLPKVNLAFAIPKSKRLDWLLEKVTELGVSKLYPIIFERSVAGGDKLTASKRDRWELHCVSACKQCRSNWIPKIMPMQWLSDFLEGDISGLKLLGDLEPETSSLAKLLTNNPDNEITILIGPEGGVSPAERDQILQAGWSPARLGNTTLRIETACIAMLAGISAILRD